MGSLREPDQREAKLVANPLQPGQMVKLYKGSTGRYSNALLMQHQKAAASSTIKTWRKLKSDALNLGVQGVSNLNATSVRPASKRS